MAAKRKGRLEKPTFPRRLEEGNLCTNQNSKVRLHQWGERRSYLSLNHLEGKEFSPVTKKQEGCFATDSARGLEGGKGLAQALHK